LKIGVGLFIYRKFVPVKKIVHIFILRTPIIGKIVYLYSISIFLRSFGTLVSSGISIDIAYSEVVETISVLPLKAYFVSRRANISGGSQLQTIFSDKRIPAHVSALVSAGQMSGLLGESLIRAANIIDVDLENQFKRLTSFIEPLMMVGVGGVVGVIALSIMMPIYDMSKVLQHA